jgi:quercetin dioxygenase-like cupin family protein
MASIADQASFWFINTLVKIRIPYEAGQDQISILEHLAPSGDSPPLHIHRNEDEVFQVLDGTLKINRGGEEIRAAAGDFLIVPKGTPHTYRVVSALDARFITVTRGPEFEGLVRHLGRPAPRDALPPHSGPPTQEQLAAIVEACKRFGIDIVGPPLN